MFPLSPIAGLSPVVKRLAVVAGVLGATVLFTPLGASADPVSSQHHHVRHSMREQKKETVEQRIATLHASLKITPDEETQWSAVAQIMRDNDAKMQGLVSARAAEPAHSLDAVDDLKTYEQFTQIHVDSLKLLISSFQTLYDTMPADQKRIADQVFQKYGHRRES